MANTPTAYGTVCAYAKTKENAKKVLNIIYGWLENVDYINAHKDEQLTAKYTNKDWITASRFTGTKRWVFEDSVRQLSEWLRKDINELKPFDFCIKFEFNDYEPESLNRYQTTITANHKAGDPKIKFKMTKCEYNECMFYPEQSDTKEIDEKEHTDEKQEN
jgi:hypothetical protein